MVSNTNSWKTPIVLDKNDDIWICQLENNREITLLLEEEEDPGEEDDDYTEQIIRVTFWENDEQLGAEHEYFGFKRSGYASSIENQGYLFWNIFIPSCLEGTGISITALEFFKKQTNDAVIFVRNPFNGNINDGSELTEQGKKFAERMQKLGLIAEYETED